MVANTQQPPVRRDTRVWYPQDSSSLARDLADARKDSLERAYGIGRRTQRYRIPAQTRRYVNLRVTPYLGNIKIVSGRKGKTHLYYGGDAIETEDDSADTKMKHGHIVISIGGRISHGRPPETLLDLQAEVG